MLLFLDFDGTLHPMPKDSRGMLCHLPQFESVLREFPHVQVVISSSWREEYPFDVIQGLFSEDLQSRIIGMTPSLPGQDLSECPRWVEINTWIQMNDYHGLWLALDDAEHEFPFDFRQLVLCNKLTGADDATWRTLRERLMAPSPNSPFIAPGRT